MHIIGAARAHYDKDHGIIEVRGAKVISFLPNQLYAMFCWFRRTLEAFMKVSLTPVCDEGWKTLPLWVYYVTTLSPLVYLDV